MRVNKKYFVLCFLAAFLLPASISLAQDIERKRTFANPDDEIRYYLTEEDYTSRRVDVIWTDEKAFDRARFLARNYDKQFIEQARDLLAQANDRELFRLIWILLKISGPDYRPLMVLLSPDSFETTFKNAPEIRAALVKRLSGNRRMPQSIHAIEALVALKYHSAIPEIVSFLDYEGNRDVLLTLYALAELDAKEELATYLQQKVLEDLCIAKDHNVRYGIRTDIVTRSVQEAAENTKSKYAPFLRSVLQKIIWQPDEAALAHYAVEGGSERLRGYAVLLLSHYRNDASLKLILDRLQNDPSGLVRFWSAQSFVNNPNAGAVDTLIAVYDRSNDDDSVRFGCVEALGKIGGEKAVATLRRALNDKHQTVREMAKFRLAQLSGNND